jgi:hypothetical protein
LSLAQSLPHGILTPSQINAVRRELVINCQEPRLGMMQRAFFRRVEEHCQRETVAATVSEPRPDFSLEMVKRIANLLNAKNTADGLGDFTQSVSVELYREDILEEYKRKKAVDAVESGTEGHMIETWVHYSEKLRALTPSEKFDAMKLIKPFVEYYTSADRDERILFILTKLQGEQCEEALRHLSAERRTKAAVDIFRENVVRKLLSAQPTSFMQGDIDNAISKSLKEAERPSSSSVPLKQISMDQYREDVDRIIQAMKVSNCEDVGSSALRAMP